MKEIYLSRAQIAKLAAGKGIVFSRGGRTFLLASKDLKKEAQSKKQKEIQKLESKLAALKKGESSSKFLLSFKPCQLCPGKKFRNLGHHMRLKHEGKRSNLPHLVRQ